MKTVTLIGLGRVGTHLLRVLTDKSIQVNEVLARKTKSRSHIASQCNVKLVNDYTELGAGSDLYILAVPDLAIQDVAKKLKDQIGNNAFVVHTSGTTSLQVLGDHFTRYGLWYPLQSFSLGADINWKGLPIFVDASNEDDFDFLFNLGNTISGNAIKISEDQRPYLHLSAVISNNFSNALFTWSKKILEDNGLSFEYLHPLIKDGLEKSLKMNPEEAQTGPAERGDINTIQKHMELLKDDPKQQEIYFMISKLINPDIEL